MMKTLLIGARGRLGATTLLLAMTGMPAFALAQGSSTGTDTGTEGTTGDTGDTEGTAGTAGDTEGTAGETEGEDTEGQDTEGQDTEGTAGDDTAGDDTAGETEGEDTEGDDDDDDDDDDATDDGATGGPAPEMDGGDEEGCACRADAPSRGWLGSLVLLGLGALARRRR